MLNYREKEEVGWGCFGKQSIGHKWAFRPSHWLSLLLGEEKACLPPAWVSSQGLLPVGVCNWGAEAVHESAPFWPPEAILNEVSFIHFPELRIQVPDFLSSGGSTIAVPVNVFPTRMCLRGERGVRRLALNGRPQAHNFLRALGLSLRWLHFAFTPLSQDKGFSPSPRVELTMQIYPLALETELWGDSLFFLEAGELTDGFDFVVKLLKKIFFSFNMKIWSRVQWSLNSCELVLFQISIPAFSVTLIKKTKTALLVPNALIIATVTDRVSRPRSQGTFALSCLCIVSPHNVLDSNIIVDSFEFPADLILLARPRSKTKFFPNFPFPFIS